jgi:DNA-directed DNA polymerase III PolC
MISTHTHVETFFTASTIEAFIKKSISLDRKLFTYTDFGTFYSVLLAYQACKKNNIKFGAGLEIFIKDSSLKACSLFPESKYFTLTVYAHDQKSFQALIKLSSQAKPFYDNINEDSIPVYSWKDIESLRSENISIVLAGHHNILAKTVLAGKSVEYLESTVSLFKELNKPLYLALIAGKEDSVWSDQIKTTIDNPKKGEGVVYFSPRDKLEVLELALNKKAKIVSIYAADLKSGNKIVSFIKNGIKFKSGVDVLSVKRESSFKPLAKDFVKECNRLHLFLSEKYNIPLISSDYAFMAEKEDKPVQDVKMSLLKKPYPFYMMSEEEYIQDLSNQGIPLSKISLAIENGNKWSNFFKDFELQYSIRVPKTKDNLDPLVVAMEQIKKVGRMDWKNPVAVDRLKREINLLAKNPVQNLIPYFFPISDMQDKEMENGVLVGPARGSGAGSFFCYLMGITHVNPLKYNLSFERFLNEDRVLEGDWPDIDCDRADRSLLSGENGILYQTYGKRAAQISTRSTMRLKSSILDVNRYLKGEVEESIQQLTKNLPSAPQGVSDQDFVFGYEDRDGNYHAGLIEYDEYLQKYAETRSEEWEIVRRCLGVTRAYGKHASAFLIADINIEDFIPLIAGESYTQYEAKGASIAGGIKYDFLVVKNLSDIQKAIDLANKRQGIKLGTGWLRHEGKDLFVWDLPEITEVFGSTWDGDTAGLFQLDTASMVPFVKDIKPQSINDLSDILALVRPGTLDAKDEITGRSMAREYVERRFGRSASHIPKLQELLPETNAIILYQEQSSRVARELAGMSPVEAEKLRKVLSKKQKIEVDKFKKMFLEGAEKNVDLDIARQIWDQIEAGSRYNFNMSHSVSYSFITYATMFLRHFYPLEFWTAILSNADKKEIKEKYYKHVRKMLLPPDINLSTEDMVIDYDRSKIRSKLTVIKGLSAASMKSFMEKRPFISIRDFVEKEAIKPAMSRKLIIIGVLDSLFEKGTTLMEKLQIYEDELELKKYNDKIKAGKKPKKGPKKGQIPTDFLSLSPLDEFKLKKQILPTMEMSLTDLIYEICPKIKKGIGKHLYEAGKKDYIFVDGVKAQEIDSSEVTNQYGVEYCTPAYIVSCNEFSYQQGTKKALKLLVECDGYNRECVLWPDYNTGKLVYPPIKEGNIAILHMKKRNQKDASIQKIIVDFI